MEAWGGTAVLSFICRGPHAPHVSLSLYLMLKAVIEDQAPALLRPPPAALREN